MALVGGLIGGFLVGLAGWFLLGGEFLDGAGLGVYLGMLIGMLSSLHSHICVGELG